MLLFLLAVAAIPGSVLPQRGVNPENVNEYFADHPDLAPGAGPARRLRGLRLALVLRDLPAAVHLAGRLHHAPAARPRPGAAVPRRRPRRSGWTGCRSTRVLAVAGRRRGGDRRGAAPAPLAGAQVRGDEVSAEKGYLKETGNLLFHFSLLAVLIGVGLGSLVRLARQPAAGRRRGQRVLQHPPAVRRVRARPAGGQPPTCPPSACGWTTSRPAFLPSGQPEIFKATVTVDGRDGPTRGGRLLGQLAAAAGRRERLPARPRVRPGDPLHRPVRQAARPAPRRS